MHLIVYFLQYVLGFIWYYISLGLFWKDKIIGGTWPVKSTTIENYKIAKFALLLHYVEHFISDMGADAKFTGIKEYDLKHKYKVYL